MVASTEPDLMSIRDRAAEMKKVMKVPDYNVSSERLTVSLRTRPEQIKKGDHPIEVMAKAERARSDPYAKLTDNQVLITNLPTVETQELASEKSVSDFLIKNVHQDL